MIFQTYVRTTSQFAILTSNCFMLWYRINNLSTVHTPMEPTLSIQCLNSGREVTPPPSFDSIMIMIVDYGL